MSFPYSPNLQDEKLESLQTQYEFLNLLRLRHQHWMNEADDPQTAIVHREVAELIEQMLARYSRLLGRE